MNLKLKIRKTMVLIIHSVRSAISDSNMPLENSEQISIFTVDKRESDESTDDSREALFAL